MSLGVREWEGEEEDTSFREYIGRYRLGSKYSFQESFHSSNTDTKLSVINTHLQSLQHEKKKKKKTFFIGKSPRPGFFVTMCKSSVHKTIQLPRAYAHIYTHRDGKHNTNKMTYQLDGIIPSQRTGILSPFSRSKKERKRDLPQREKSSHPHKKKKKKLFAYLADFSCNNLDTHTLSLSLSTLVFFFFFFC